MKNVSTFSVILLRDGRTNGQTQTANCHFDE